MKITAPLAALLAGTVLAGAASACEVTLRSSISRPISCTAATVG